MDFRFNTHINRAVPALTLLFAGSIAAAIAPAADLMPAAQQNALVQKYCTVCHTDAFPGGRISFEHFDAAHPDPGVAAMMASKLKGNALGASGQPLPDRAIQDALLSSLTAESAGADAWVVDRTPDPVSGKPLFSVSIVQQIPRQPAPNLYRLTLTCQPRTHQAMMQVAWSPDVPKTGQAMPVELDGKPLFTYTVEGKETMGNGQAGTSGPGAAVLYATADHSAPQPSALPLPQQTLTVRDLFPGDTVVFPFASLDPATRKSLEVCFARNAASD